MVRSIASRFAGLPLAGAIVLVGMMLVPTVSHADPYGYHGRGGGWHDQGRYGGGWHGGGWHGGGGWRGPSLIIGPRLLPPPIYYAPPPIYYAPPPVYYAPRGPAYYAPPPVYAAPSLSLGVNIPLR